MTRFRKTFSPKNLGDLTAFLFLTLAAVAVFFHNLYLISFIINHQTYGYCFYLPVVLFFFICLNVLGNFVYLLLIDTSIMTMYSSSKLKPNWRFCFVCEANAPPRSFHCDICKLCILKREHHCIFTGCCVGYFNHRYYFAFLFHMWLGALVSMYFNYYAGYFKVYFSGSHYWSVPYQICPILFLLIGSIDFKAFLAFMISAIIAFGCMFLSALLFYHSSLIAKGQTSFEKSHKIRKYSLNHWIENVKEVLGKHWIQALLWFNYHSPLIGDGITFHTADKYL